MVLVTLLAGPAAARPLHFKRLTSAEGLSQNTVAAILQDRKGYVWLATADGLNRFDGYSLVLYRHDPDRPDSLADNYLCSLAEAPDGKLWIGTAGNGLDLFDPDTGTVTHFRHDPNDPSSLPSDRDVKALTIDQDGTLWVGTAAGLARLPAGATRFELIALGAEQGPIAIRTLHRGGSGRIYAGTGIGVYAATPGSGQFEKLTGTSQAATSSLTVNAVHEDGDGAVWLGTEKAGLFILRRLNDGTYRLDPTTVQTNKDVTAILPGEDGRLWLGTWQSGLLEYDTRTGRLNSHMNSLADPRSLSSDTVVSLMRDATGMIWAGTLDRGVNRFTSTVLFEHYYRDPLRKPTLPNNTVWAFAAADDGQVWMATQGGLGLFSLTEERFVHFDVPDGANAMPLNGDVRAVAVTGDSLWIGTWGSGLLQWNRSTGKLIHIAAHSSVGRSLSNDQVRLILPGRGGRLWVGTQEGLNMIDLATGRIDWFHHNPAEPSSSLPHNRIRALYEDRQGTLWIGTSGGISRHNPDGTFTTWNVRTSAPGTLKEDDIRAIHEDAAGILWLATANGLTRFDPMSGPVATYDERHGFRNGTLYGILSDGQGQLWISTNFGLARFNPETAEVRTFTSSDGLQDNEFNFGAFLKLPGGSMLFGGIGGFNHFQPDQVIATPSPSTAPPLILQNISVLSSDGTNTEYPSNGYSIRLSHRDTVLTIRYAALQYDSPNAMEYSTRLVGLDPSWSPARADTREVRLTELPAGDYVFRVRAVSVQGMPSRNEITIPLFVQPAPWRTPWAYAGYFLVALLLAGGAHLARIRFLARDTARLRHEVNRQTRELTDKAGEIAAKNSELHNLLRVRSDLYRTLSHELHTPLTVVLSALQSMRGARNGEVASWAIDAGLSNARRLSRLVDQLLQLAKTDRAPDGQYLPVIADAAMVAMALLPGFRVLAAARGIMLTEKLIRECHLHVSAQEIEMIIENLVSNALKYTHKGGKVHLSVTRLNDTVTIAVTDTGIGIPAKHHETIFHEFFRVPEAGVERRNGAGLGLALVRKLADRHGGLVSLDSRPGEGSRFMVCFPQAPPPAGPAPIPPAEGSVSVPALPAVPVSADPSPRTGNAETMVIIEDDPELVEWLPRLFEPEFSCHVANDVDGGLELIRAIMPDLVLCDVMLRLDPADRGGFAVVEAIRHDPAISHVPVVILTALGDDDSRLAGLGREVDDYITKPFENDELYARVRNLISNRRRMAEHVRRTLMAASSTPSMPDVALPNQDFLETLPLDEASRRFLRQLEGRLADGIIDDKKALPEIAATLGIGERQLQRRIKECCGLSFTEFRTAMRMYSARRLLSTEMTMTEIAHELGYSSGAHFTQVFKRAYGMPPSEWRAKQLLGSKPGQGIEITLRM